MTHAYATVRPAVAGILCALLLGQAAASAGEAADRHAVWRGCLDRNFGVQAALSGPTLAADAALRSCREAEAAYLAALTASPLLDGEEIMQARPALAERARGWLLGRRASL